MNETETRVEVGIAVISEIYQLDVMKVTGILQKLGSITHEQCETILAICTALMAREKLNNQASDPSGSAVFSA